MKTKFTSTRQAWVSPQQCLVILALAFIFLILFLASGCAFTLSKTEVYTPAIWQMTTNAGGIVSSNLVTAAKKTTTYNRERVWLPPGYDLLVESDVYGLSAEFASPSSPNPNVKAGVVHTSMRWICTSTNPLYTAPVYATAALDNRVIPFDLAESGTFVAGASATNFLATNTVKTVTVTNAIIVSSATNVASSATAPNLAQVLIPPVVSTAGTALTVAVTNVLGKVLQ